MLGSLLSNQPKCTIQPGKERALTVHEKSSCEWLLMENNPVYKDNAEEDDASVEEVTPTAEIEVEAFSFGDLLASSAESAVKEKEKTKSDYVNMDHSLASASLLLLLNVFGPSLLPCVSCHITRKCLT